jgi:electron transfer flavoprotein alpha subunit
MRPIALVAEHDCGQLKPVTGELIAFARKLGRHLSSDTKVKVVILGEAVSDIGGSIAAASGLDVIALQCPAAREYNSEVYLRALADVFHEMAPAFICLAHTSRGLDYGPLLAVKLDAGCISQIDDVCMVGDRIGFRRPVFGGKFVSRVTPLSQGTVVMVQPGVFRADTKKPQESGTVSIRSLDLEPRAIESLGTQRAERTPASITEARVVVSAGKGIGAKETLELTHQLAALFPKSALAGSRIVCDMGWLDHRQQVGVTGATVSPALYMACGISGALQHVLGMRGSGFVVSINTDPNAAIFNESDVCIVEDLKEFIPVFIEACKKMDGHR